MGDLGLVELLLRQVDEKLNFLQPEIIALPQGTSRAQFTNFVAQLKKLAVERFGIDDSVVELAAIQDIERILNMAEPTLADAQKRVDASI